MTVDVSTTAGSLGWENAPSHYQGIGGIENFDVWDAYRMDPYTANAFKYLARWDKKGSPLNDLKKAAHYIEEVISRWEGGLWLEWEPAPRYLARRFPPEVVTGAFGLSGHVAMAVEHLLYWRSNNTPGEDIRSALRYAERAVRAQGE